VQEHALDSALENMTKEWDAARYKLKMVEYRQTKTAILMNTDPLFALLDEQILKTQTIRGRDTQSNQRR
jgi:hypothetical protein